MPTRIFQQECSDFPCSFLLMKATITTNKQKQADKYKEIACTAMKGICLVNACVLDWESLRPETRSHFKHAYIS